MALMQHGWTRWRFCVQMSCMLILAMCLLPLPAAAKAGLDDEARAYLARKPVISIGVVADNEPYSWVDGVEPAGFSIDVLEEIARQAGVSFSYRFGSWPEIYPAFMRGEIDAIDEISFRQDRAEKVLFTEPYHFRQTAIMHDGNRPLGPIGRLEDLKPYRVGVVRDIFYKNQLASSGIEVVEFDAIPNLVRALAFGWVDAVVGPEVTLMFIAHKSGLRHLTIAGKVEMGGYEREDFRIGVRRDNPVLHRILQAGLNAIPQQRIDELLEAWQQFGGQALTAPARFRLSEQQTAYVRRLGPLRVGVMRDYAPFSFVDQGQLQGLAVDVLNRVADMTGLQVITVADHWTRLIELFERGEIDIMTNISDIEARRSFTRFSQPYHVIPNVAFTRQESLRLTRPEDLDGLRIAVGAGIFYEAALRRRFGDAVVSFSSQDAMFRALREGSVDVVIAALANGNHWIRELGLSDVRIAGELDAEGIRGEDLRFGMRPALEPLVAIVNAALGAITPTERRLIENRWLGAATLPAEAARPVAAGLVLSDAEQAYLDARGRTIRACVDPDWMPLEGLDRAGQATGMSAEFMDLFAARGKLSFDVLPVRTWIESLEAARARRCDILPMVLPTPGRMAFMDFTRPYFTSPNVLLGRVEAPFVERLSELDGRKLGIVRGYAFVELFATRHPDIRLVEVDNEIDGLKRLQRGEIDAYLGNLITASHHLQELRLADIKVVGRVPYDWSVAVATRGDEPMLLSIMQKLVDSLSDEDRRRIETKWRSMRLEQRVDYTLVWQVLAVTVFGLGLLFLWNRKLGGLNRKLAETNAQLAEANARLDELNLRDGLTGIGNRRHVDRYLEPLFRHSQRHGLPFAIGLLDLDHFKQINDRYGHEAGDVCLRAISTCLQSAFRRSNDHVARYGGEEFVVFMSPVAGEDPLLRFEQLRHEVEALEVRHEDQVLRLTVSVGVASGVPLEDTLPAAYLRIADEAMYEAKRTGRNRVVGRQLPGAAQQGE